MTAFLTKLSAIHARTPEQKMAVLEHNIHIKLMAPVALWFITLPFITPVFLATTMALLSGLFMSLFFMPAPYWSANKITTSRRQNTIKAFAFIGFITATIVGFISAIACKVTLGWFLLQYISVYMSVFLLTAIIIKTANSQEQ